MIGATYLARKVITHEHRRARETAAAIRAVRVQAAVERHDRRKPARWF